MFLELLEDKHFGKLSPQLVFKLANSTANFANLWLVHSIRSNCSLAELALAIAASIKWNTPSLNTLESYLNIENFSPSQVNSDIAEAVLYSKKIISDFCDQRQAKLLIKLQTMTITNKEVIDAHKFTCNIPVSTGLVNNIVNSCKPYLKNVSLFGGQGQDSKNEGIRNNTHFPTPMPNDSMALALLENLLAKASGLAISVAEPPVILRYQPGQYYKWHYDHIYPHTDDIKQHIAQFGQRVKTAIFYLNDDFTGGETEFKTPFSTVSPERNKALIFDNCDKFEKRDSSSIHRGNSVIAGEKWVVTLWFRNKPFWLRSGLL